MGGAAIGGAFLRVSQMTSATMSFTGVADTLPPSLSPEEGATQPTADATTQVAFEVEKEQCKAELSARLAKTPTPMLPAEKTAPANIAPSASTDNRTPGT